MNYWLTCIFLCLTQNLWAAEVLPLPDTFPVPLGRHVSWIAVTPDDPAYHENQPGPWMDGRSQKRGSSDILHFSFTPNRYWIALKVSNPSVEPRRAVIEASTAWLDKLVLFSGPGFTESQQTGDLLPHSAWAQPFRYPAFTISLQPGEQKNFWLLLESQDNMVIPLQIWDYDHYIAWDNDRSLYYGLYNGLMLAICVLNAAIFIFSRRRSFLIYTLYMGSYTLMQFTLDGFLATAAPFIPPWLINRFYGPLNLSTVAFAGLFTIQFLETEQYAPALARFMKWSCRIFLAVSVLFLATPFYGTSVQAGLLVSLCFAPIGLVCAAQAIKARRRAANFYAMAWAPLILSIIILGLTSFSILPPAAYSRGLIYFSIAMEFIILSIGLGDQLARAIRKHARIMSNLEAAEAVQKALIPTRPSAPGFSIHSWYQAAESTAGDWYDVIHDTNHQRLYCFIGDVTGHGIPSTLVASAVAGAVHSFLEERFQSGSSLEQTLEDLVTTINRTVNRTGLSSGRLLTMNLIGIDLRTYKGLLLNAGHCHPLLFQKNEVIPLTCQGSMLGLSLDIGLMKKTFQMQPGDILFLYSDGLIHRHSKAFEELKLHRLISHIRDAGSAEEMIKRVKLKFLETYGSHHLEDDCSLLVLQVLT